LVFLLQSRVAWSLVFLGLMVGCDTTPAKLEFVPESRPQVSKAPATDKRPHIRIEPLEDARPDSENLGSVAGRAFSSGQLKQLVESELQRIASGSFVVASTEAEPVVFVLRPKLLKAYVGSISTSKTAVIVLECGFRSPDGTTSSSVFRGQYQALNWSSGEDEVKRSLVQALNRCLEEVQSELFKRAGATS